jgi:hypothetical protein
MRVAQVIVDLQWHRGERDDFALGVYAAGGNVRSWQTMEEIVRSTILLDDNYNVLNPTRIRRRSASQHDGKENACASERGATQRLHRQNPELLSFMHLTS